MSDAEMIRFKEEVIKTIQSETHEAIKHTGNAWIKDAVREIVPIAIKETFMMFGIDPKDPIAVQKDMSYLRELRADSEDRKKAVWNTVIRFTTSGFLSAFVAYLVSKN